MIASTNFIFLAHLAFFRFGSEDCSVRLFANVETSLRSTRASQRAFPDRARFAIAFEGCGKAISRQVWSFHELGVPANCVGVL